MKTRCPACQTTFRVTPDQLKARAGNVRCGQCQTVFNALDNLLDEVGLAFPASPASTITADSLRPSPSKLPESPDFPAEEPPLQTETVQASQGYTVDILLEAAVDDAKGESSEVAHHALTETAAQELGKAIGLILPRETTEIPGYSRWAESVMSAPESLPAEKKTRWPFILVAVFLTLALVGQLVFRFRSEIAITTPSLRPMLEALCNAFDADLPLPRHVELVSIESSDLQADPAHGNLLALNATLRNRANYVQAYPSLELSLTDTNDAAIARRVFRPEEYLSPKIPSTQPFAANSETPVRLWIEAREISASGYRLYVFYP